MQKGLKSLPEESMLILAGHFRGGTASLWGTCSFEELWVPRLPPLPPASIPHQVYKASVVVASLKARVCLQWSEGNCGQSSYLSHYNYPGDAKQMTRLELPCPFIDPPHCSLGENHLEASLPIHKNMAGVAPPVAGVGMESWLIFFESTWLPGAFCDFVVAVTVTWQ